MRQLFLQFAGRATPFGQQLDHVGGDTNCLGRVHQGPLDRLLDPVTGVGAETGVHPRIEPFDRPQQSQVAFLDQVLQTESLAGVAAGYVDHQAQVGTDHPVPGIIVATLNPVGQLLLLVGIEERSFIDLTEICFQGRLNHIASLPARSGHREFSSAS